MTKTNNKQIFFTCSKNLINKIDEYYLLYFDKSRYTKSQFIEDMLKIGVYAFETKMKQVKEELEKETKGEN